MSDKLSFEKLRTIFFFSLIAILALAMLALLGPFLYPIFWAAIIAILFTPFYEWLHKHIPWRGVNLFLTLTAVVLIILLPLTLLAVIVVHESLDLYRFISTRDLQQALGTMSEWLKGTPLSPYLDLIRDRSPEFITKVIQTVSGWLFENVRSISQNSFRFSLMIAIMFYTLYYFLKDGAQILKRIMRLSPLGDRYEAILYKKFTSTARATLKSTVIIGGVQGFLGAILFAIAGIEGAFLWGIIMVLLGIIPALGPVIILIPTGIVMLILGNVWQAVVLLVGAFLVSIIDNLLRPPLIGRDTKMHPLIIFLSTIGGIIAFGVSGFIIGPVIAALFISIISIYEQYYHEELKEN